MRPSLDISYVIEKGGGILGQHWTSKYEDRTFITVKENEDDYLIWREDDASEIVK